MGSYTTRAISSEEYRDIVNYIRDGYLDHRPNPQIATILVLEANLGCRIGDIVHLTTDNFICDAGIWKISLIEQKTGKTRCFIVPKPVKDFIDVWLESNNIVYGRLFSIEPPAVWKALRQVRDFLELDNVSTHSFRKKISSDIYNKTHDIEAVRAFLNHSSIATTQRYIRRTNKQLEDAIESSTCIV